MEPMETQGATALPAENTHVLTFLNKKQSKPSSIRSEPNTKLKAKTEEKVSVLNIDNKEPKSIDSDELISKADKDKVDIQKGIFKTNENSEKRVSIDLPKQKNQSESSLKKDSEFFDLKISQALAKQREKEPFGFKVAILHELHPKEILTPQLIQKIRILLLKELDRTMDQNVRLNFVASTVREGWFTLTCHNVETTNWLISSIKKIQPYITTNIKIIPVNDRYMSIVYLSPEDAMQKDVFLSRLAKQNVGLSTDDWQILSMFEVDNGRQCITLSIDEMSKEIIQNQNNKLFLNFTQIEMHIEKAVQLSVSKHTNLEQTLKETNKKLSKKPANDDKTSSNYESYSIVRENESKDVVASNSSSSDSKEKSNDGKKIKFTKSSSGRGIYPTKILASLRTTLDDTAKNKKHKK